ncbi:MAG: bifunctional lysylphosphatidylglycerol flippase/synthetase MprF [Cellulosilyticaceae bacterium]
MFTTKFKYATWTTLYILLIYLINRQSFEWNISSIMTDLNSIPLSSYILYMIIAYIVLSATTLYDFILCHTFHLPLNPKQIFKISWLADLPITFAEEQKKRKGGLRYLLYKYAGIESDKASSVSIIKEIFLTGDENRIPENFKLTGIVRLKLIMSFFIKWLSAGLFFVFIYYSVTKETPIVLLLALFTLGMGIGNLVMMPASFGFFELVVIFGASISNLPIHAVLLALILFRIFYYVLPWFTTLIIVSRSSQHPNTKKLSASQKNFIHKLSIKSLATLIFFVGAVLLLFSAIPTDTTRLPLITPDSPTILLYIARIITIGIGFLLMILSKGIWDKVRSAYYITLYLLIIGAIVSLFKGFQIELTIILLLGLWALIPSKEMFYRMPTKLTFKRFVISMFIVCLPCAIYFVFFSILSPDEMFVLLNQTNFVIWIELNIILIFIVICSILLTLLSARIPSFPQTTEEDLDKLKTFLSKYEGNSMTHLIFLKDKSLFYTMSEQVLIAYRPYKDKLIVLGDPIGETSLFTQAINEFRIFADQLRMIPVFYEVSEEHLPIYHENGFKFLKLGEEATMDLSQFTLVGKKGAALRTIKNKMLRGELTFELLEPPFSDEIMSSLQNISSLWLEDRKEKEFSLGSFESSYINRTPVGIVRQNDAIIAFATIMPMYSNHSVSIDLMRLIPDPPNGTMDALFIGLIEWAIEQNYKYFVLGKAPLSNVGATQFSPTKEKMVKYIYNYGNKIYSFKGLRRYKEKFYPNWKGIYFAYPKHTNLSVILIQLTKMISGSDS